MKIDRVYHCSSLGFMKKYFTVDLFMIASSYFKNAKNYRTVRTSSLQSPQKQISSFVLFFVCFGPHILYLQNVVNCGYGYHFTLISIFSLFLIYINRISAGILLSQVVLLVFQSFCLFLMSLQVTVRKWLNCFTRWGDIGIFELP